MANPRLRFDNRVDTGDPWRSETRRELQGTCHLYRCHGRTPSIFYILKATDTPSAQSIPVPGRRVLITSPALAFDYFFTHLRRNETRKEKKKQQEKEICSTIPVPVQPELVPSPPTTSLQVLTHLIFSISPDLGYHPSWLSFSYPTFSYLPTHLELLLL